LVSGVLIVLGLDDWVEYVLTVERDVAVPGLARLNPWPVELFTNPGMGQIVCNLTEETEGFEDVSFSCLIRDPPTMGLAGELYSGDFCRELCRVLRRRGKLFHCTGRPKSKLGRSTARGVARRLPKVGFVRVKSVGEAFGLVMYKGG
jgi:hypothetical protein